MQRGASKAGMVVAVIAKEERTRGIRGTAQVFNIHVVRVRFCKALNKFAELYPRARARFKDRPQNECNRTSRKRIRDLLTF